MKYIDKVYGEVEIDEPLILEIIESPCFQRLKGISQAGYFEVHFPGTYFSRFDHSVGVFILLRQFDAPFEEQTAGLLHDISHSAFSHCIDYALDEGSEKEHNHQDNIFVDFVKTTKIPDILKKYNFNLDYVLNEDNFPLLERKLPDLCADRIDYSLRTAAHFGAINQKEINLVLDNLVIKNSQWVFSDLKSAKKYAQLFLELNENYYASLPSAIMFRTVGDTIKYALKEEYISKDDLWTADEEVLEKIRKHQKRDRKLDILLKRMDNKIKFENNPNNYDARVFCKSRIVDPLFKESGLIKRLSDIDERWAEVVEAESKPKEYFIKFSK